MQWRSVRRLSVCLSVCINFCANRFFSQTNGRIATKLSQDGLQVSVHPGCAQAGVDTGRVDPRVGSGRVEIFEMHYFFFVGRVE